MKHRTLETTRSPEEQSKIDVVAQVSNEIQDTLLHHAPDDWPEETLDEIEQRVLDHTHRLIDLKPRWAAQKHIAWAVDETKRLIQERSKGIDMEKLLDVLMSVSEEDDVVLQLAFLTLDQSKITASLAEARRIVGAELQHKDVAHLLTEACVRALLRGARWTRLQQARRTER